MHSHQTAAGGEQRRSGPNSYAAPDVADSTLTPPAVGEVADFMDEGDALGADDVQLGSTNRNRPRNTGRDLDQEPQTRQANREQARSGSRRCAFYRGPLETCRARKPRRNSSKAPREIASRIAVVSAWKKAMLCQLRSTLPRISSVRTR